MKLTYSGLFSGAAGLDLGFEKAGFSHTFSSDIDEWAVKTLHLNRPKWGAVQADVHDLTSKDLPESDVLLAGFPCQGFSLGGDRNEDDERNYLFKQVVRLARSTRPRLVVIENVLNLRTMKEPVSGKMYVDLIAEAFQAAGYHVKHEVFKVCEFGVPQTRRRFIFLASRDPFPAGFAWPSPSPDTPASAFLGDFAAQRTLKLPNHNPVWGFNSSVHLETGADYDPALPLTACRFSRTASDGNPIRTLGAPFPAIDTATIWGWAQGDVKAVRVKKDRETGMYVRNKDSKALLWRITAPRLRQFTHREYARLQTFPDDWAFVGTNLRHVHKQIGNAVPVEFARRVACFVSAMITAQVSGKAMRLEAGVKGKAQQSELPL